MKRAC